MFCCNHQFLLCISSLNPLSNLFQNGQHLHPSCQPSHWRNPSPHQNISNSLSNLQDSITKSDFQLEDYKFPHWNPPFSSSCPLGCGVITYLNIFLPLDQGFIMELLLILLEEKKIHLYWKTLKITSKGRKIKFWFYIQPKRANYIVLALSYNLERSKNTPFCFQVTI